MDTGQQSPSWLTGTNEAQKQVLKDNGVINATLWVRVCCLKNRNEDISCKWGMVDIRDQIKKTSPKEVWQYDAEGWRRGLD